MASSNVSSSGSTQGEGSDGLDGETPRGSKALIPILLVVAVIVAVGAIVAAFGLFGSGGDGETVKSGDKNSADSPRDSAGGSVSDSNGKGSVGTNPDGSTENGQGGGVGKSGGAAASPESTTGSNELSDDMSAASTNPVQVPFPAQAVALIKTVMVAGQDGFDRVVFEFDGPVPGYDVRYVPGPLTEDPSDRPIDIEGTKILLVSMSPASGVSLDGDVYRSVYSGPDRLAGPNSPVAEVVRAGDFESVLTWAIGVRGERPFKVSTLDAPSRLVVDVKR